MRIHLWKIADRPNHSLHEEGQQGQLGLATGLIVQAGAEIFQSRDIDFLNIGEMGNSPA
jgi:hypothetical protein